MKIMSSHQSVKRYSIVRIISENKRTGGAQITARDDKGRIVTRHVDRFMQGNNPNRECVRLHAFCVARVASLESSIERLKKSLAMLGEGKLTITKPMTPDVLKTIWVGRTVTAEQNLVAAKATLTKLQQEMPLVALFVR